VHGSCAPAFEPVREAFTRNLEEGDLGASCAVSVGGELVVDLWGGHRALARRLRWERDTLVNVWSTT
jgi:CubicO group peptidase (beta-lactamase class C family)